MSSVNDTSVQGKILFFGIIILCILVFFITILKTRACGDNGEKLRNSEQPKNVPIQPEPTINIQNKQPLIQP